MTAPIFTNQIAEAYARPGYIAGVPLLHAALRFRYRPARMVERSRMLKELSQLDGSGLANVDKGELLVAKFIASRIVEWDHVDHDGQPIEVSPKAVMDLLSPVGVRLYGMIVSGVDGGDGDPKWDDEAAGEHQAVASETEASGQSVANVQQGRDEKN